jgi:hypothetical protein
MKATTAADGVAKGGAMGVVVYLCDKYNIDPVLTALAMPLVAAALALVSTKIGDPAVASFFAAKKEAAK